MPSYVDAVEMQGSQPATYEEGRWKGVRRFKVRWADKAAFVQQMVGDWTPGSPYKPDQFPGMVVPCWAKSAAVKPLGAIKGGTGLAFYEDAEVEIRYETPQVEEQQQQDEVAIVESMSLSSQIITMPKGTYKFPDNSTLEEGFGKLMGLIEWTIRIPQWSTFNVTNVLSKLGKVNSGTYRGFEAKKLLFQTAQAERQWTSQGASAWSVELRFLYREKKWTEFINPVNGQWQALTPDPYETDSFNGLLPI